ATAHGFSSPRARGGGSLPFAVANSTANTVSFNREPQANFPTSPKNTTSPSPVGRPLFLGFTTLAE
ncbi:MAG: hypothetical protein AAFO02_14410, partial [Bacteroidota bacterium]